MVYGCLWMFMDVYGCLGCLWNIDVETIDVEVIGRGLERDGWILDVSVRKVV